MTPFESAVRGSVEGSHGGRAHVRDDHCCHRATPLCGTQLAPITFTHKSDAEHWLRLQQRAIERGEWPSPEEEAAQRPELHTLQETYERFLAQRPRPLALSTLTAYEQDWRLRIVPIGGPSVT